MEADRTRQDGELHATVRHCGPAGGSVVCDDGREVSFTASVVDRRLRVLHPGQRVRLRTAGARVTALTLVSLPLPAG